MNALWRSAETRRPRGLPGGARRQSRRADACTVRSVSRRSACGPATTSRTAWMPRDAPHRPDPGDDDRMNPLAEQARSCSGSRPPATRPVSASSAAPPCSRTRSPRRWTSTPATAASFPRWPPAPISRRSTPTLRTAVADAGIELADVDAIAVTSGPGLSGALMVGVGRREGARRRRSASRSTRSTTSSVTSAPTCSMRRAVPATPSSFRRSLCSSRAATPRCCWCATWCRMWSCSARPSTTPRERPSTRSPGCSGLPYPGGPQIDRVAADGDPRAIRFPRGLTKPEGPGGAPLRLLVLGSQDGGRAVGGAAAGCGRGRARWRTSLHRSVRPSWMC